ncbi:box J3-like isoform X2, partial [Argonauta hians]
LFCRYCSGSYWAIDNNPSDDPVPSRQKRRRLNERASPYSPEPTMNSHQMNSPTLNAINMATTQTNQVPPLPFMEENSPPDNLSASFRSLYKSVFEQHNNGQQNNTTEFIQNFDNLKENVRLASSCDWQNIDVSHFQGLVENIRLADMNNWSLNPEQFADLASSLNSFFSQTGLSSPCLSDVAPQPMTSIQYDDTHHNTGPAVADMRGAHFWLCSPNSYCDTSQPPMPDPLMNNQSCLAIPTDRNSINHQPAGHYMGHPIPPMARPNSRYISNDDIEDEFNWDKLL